MKKDLSLYPYLEPNRLSDVIRLIIVLAVEESNFRKENGLKAALHDEPRSVKDKKWLTLAKHHPEFFRFNQNGESIILLIRFSLQRDVEPNELRPPLSIDETQKLIDQAIALHDKQLANYQRDSGRTAVTAAYIAAIATLIAAAMSYFVAVNVNDDIKKDITIIKTRLEILQSCQKK